MNKPTPLCKIFERDGIQVVVMRACNEQGPVVEISFEDEHAFMRQTILPSAPGPKGMQLAFDSIEEDFAFQCRDIGLGVSKNDYDHHAAARAFEELVDNTPALNMVEAPTS